MIKGICQKLITFQIKMRKMLYSCIWRFFKIPFSQLIQFFTRLLNWALCWDSSWTNFVVLSIAMVAQHMLVFLLPLIAFRSCLVNSKVSIFKENCWNYGWYINFRPPPNEIKESHSNGVLVISFQKKKIDN